MAAGDISHAEVPGVLLSNSYGSPLSPLYTVPANNQGLFIEIALCNIDSAALYMPEVQFVANGQSPGSAYKVVSAQSGNALSPGESRVYSFNPMLSAGSTIYAKADTSNKISCRIGITLKATA